MGAKHYLRTLAVSCKLAAVHSANKSKHGNRVVAYIRLKAKEHAQISKIAQKRGYPHTFASVAAEMISKALKMEHRE